MIRTTLAVILLYWSYKGLRDLNQSGNKKILNIIEGILALFLLIGLWTQAAAGIAAIGLLVCIIVKVKNRAFLTGGVNYIFILFIMALSLMFTGSGWWGFDMPL